MLINGLINRSGGRKAINTAGGENGRKVAPCQTENFPFPGR
jgi:hypothetical protein